MNQQSLPLQHTEQVGGSHYQRKDGGEQHWTRAYRMQFDCFQYIITKWVERWKLKGGVEDLKKARHALDEYIKLVDEEGGATAAYVNQD